MFQRQALPVSPEVSEVRADQDRSWPHLRTASEDPYLGANAELACWQSVAYAVAETAEVGILTCTADRADWVRNRAERDIQRRPAEDPVP